MKIEAIKAIEDEIFNKMAAKMAMMIDKEIFDNYQKFKSMLIPKEMWAI